MITYVNSQNSARYNRLFSKATKALSDAGELKLTYVEVPLEESQFGEGMYFVKTKDGKYVQATNAFDPTETYYEPSNGITSLAEYFGSIVELAEIDKIYTVLPLDEDVFEIDANTREISVPQTFAKNGVSVQGDHISEIVYFLVDRFYDNQDLDNCNVYIEWQLSQKDENGNTIQGISAPYIADVTSNPGKILIGWCLNNDITKYAGNVQFAVRFYIQDEVTNMLTYSLSTKTATVAIKSTLDFNIPQMMLDGENVFDEDDKKVLERLVDSTATGDTTKAMPPVFIENLAETVSFATEVGYTMQQVEAVSPDGGTLSYVWRMYDIDTNEYIGLLTAQNIYVQTTDTAQSNTKYYYKSTATEDGVPAYELMTEEELRAVDWATPTGVLERKSQVKITATGRYVAVATNRVGKSRESTLSVICQIFHPSEVTIVKDIDESLVLKEAEEFKGVLTTQTGKSDSGVITYQWYKIKPENVKNAFDDEGKLKKVQTKHYDNKDKPNLVTSVDINTPWEKIADAVNPIYTIVGSNDATDKTGAVGDGYYAVVATNSINNETSTEETRNCRVTHTASPVTIEISSFDGHGDPVVDTPKKTELKVDYAIAHSYGLKVDYSLAKERGEGLMRTDADTITYQWYKYYKGTNSNIDEDVQDAALGNYNFDGDVPIDGETQPIFKPKDNEGGYYYCMVRNTYNGTTADRCSKFFLVVSIQD